MEIQEPNEAANPHFLSFNSMIQINLDQSPDDIDMATNKDFVYKLIQNNGGQISIESLWDVFEALPEIENTKDGHKYLNNQDDLERVLEQLEADDKLVFEDNEDLSIVRIL